MSPTPSRRAAKATVRPSGEKSGDSGSSTISRSIRCSISRDTTFCTTSERCLPFRTKYARRSPPGAQEIRGTVLKRAPGELTNSKP